MGIDVDDSGSNALGIDQPWKYDSVYSVHFGGSDRFSCELCYSNFHQHVAWSKRSIFSQMELGHFGMGLQQRCGDLDFI